MAHAPDCISIQLYPDKDLLGRDVGHRMMYVDCPPDRVYLLDPSQVATSDDNGETWKHPLLPPDVPTDDDADEDGGLE